jgi:cell fate regulator YaaT (PSP1 superfamily)
MLIAQVQFAPWDKAYDFSVGQLNLAAGDYVVVDTELGRELGRVILISDKKIPDGRDKTEEAVMADADAKKEGAAPRELKPILRKAEYDDIAALPTSEKKEETLAFCRERIVRHGLPMKLIDVHFSFEGNRMNFAFISDGRVDFRELVKDLAGHFNASIRLTQIGTRDEAKISGDCGPCGRGLCCQGFLDEFSSITSEMAEAQQVVHRGSERISGMCGRLMCCLAYEYEGYKEMAGKLPPLGTKLKINGGSSGTVVGHHILKQTVDVRIPAERPDERDVIIEVDADRNRRERNTRR